MIKKNYPFIIILYLSIFSIISYYNFLSIIFWLIIYNIYFIILNLISFLVFMFNIYLFLTIKKEKNDDIKEKEKM